MTAIDPSPSPRDASDSGATVRKVTAALFISLDGVVESPDQWQFDLFDADMARMLSAHIASEGTILLGRRTYEEWAPYWPTSNDEPYASHINNTPKVVVSTTLDDVAWGEYDNVRLVNGDLPGEIARLKQQPGRNIGVAGSPTLVHTMLRDGLLDELALMIHPVIVGRGKRLFEDWRELQRVALVNTFVTSSGVVFATYRPRPTD